MNDDTLKLLKELYSGGITYVEIYTDPCDSIWQDVMAERDNRKLINVLDDNCFYDVKIDEKERWYYEHASGLTNGKYNLEEIFGADNEN